MSEAEAPPLRRRIARGLLGLLSALTLTELGALLIHLVVSQQCFSYTEMDARRERLTAAQAEMEGAETDGLERPDFMHHEVLHPYVGYVAPTQTEDGPEAPWPETLRLIDPPPDSLRVVLIGGSVAGQVGQVLHEALIEAGAPEEQLITANLGMGGVKQPQQLALVSYLFAVGVHMEVLINLDGFNEAVLPTTDNHAHGVYPFYPRSWHMRLPDLGDPRTVRAIGRLAVLREERADAATWLGGSMLRFSVFANVAWVTWDNNRAARMAQSRRALEEVGAAESHDYRRGGPLYEEDRAQLFSDSADVWGRSSIAIDQLARARGILYLHALQPNQYLEGTKPLSAEELACCVHDDSPYEPHIAEGYAALQAAGPALLANNVRFHDLTRALESDERTLYEDDCCHFNVEGRRVLARHLARLVMRTIAEEAPPEDDATPEPTDTP